MHRRAIIRKYVATMLSQKMDTGGRVFMSRPSPLLLDELPAVCIFWGPEKAEISSGDRYNPREYERTGQLMVDILVEEPRDPQKPGNLAELSQEGEDLVDRLAFQAEVAMMEDPTLGLLLPDYDPEDGEGLAEAVTLDNSTPYTLPDEKRQDRRVLGMRVQFNVYYSTEAVPNKRHPDFLDYHMDLVAAEPAGAAVSGTGKVRQ